MLEKADGRIQRGDLLLWELGSFPGKPLDCWLVFRYDFPVEPQGSRVAREEDV